MKQIKKPTCYLTILFLASAIVAAACSSTGLQRSDNFNSSLQTVENFIDEIIIQLDVTGTSLEELIELGQNQGDLEPAFEYYSKNASDLQAMHRGFSEEINGLISNGERYLEEWGDDYENPEIQRQSEMRRDKVNNLYERIEVQHTGVLEAFRAYMSDINEIERYLSNDLTIDGINSMQAVARTSKRNGDNLKEELRDLQSAVVDTRSEITRNG